MPTEAEIWAAMHGAIPRPASPPVPAFRGAVVDTDRLDFERSERGPGLHATAIDLPPHPDVRTSTDTQAATCSVSEMCRRPRPMRLFQVSR